MLKLSEFIDELNFRFCEYPNLENKINEYVSELVITDENLIQGIYEGQRIDLVLDFCIFLNK
jgi:hypothetical protein